MPETSDSIEQLTEAIEFLASHVHLLCRVIDDFREDFQWAVQNGRVDSPFDRNDSELFSTKAVTSAVCEVDELTGHLEVVTHGLRDVRERLTKNLDENRVEAARENTPVSESPPSTAVLHDESQPTGQLMTFGPRRQRGLFDAPNVEL